MSSRLSKIRSVHTYVMLRTVYFGWICSIHFQEKKNVFLSFMHFKIREYRLGSRFCVNETSQLSEHYLMRFEPIWKKILQNSGNRILIHEVMHFDSVGSIKSENWAHLRKITQPILKSQFCSIRSNFWHVNQKSLFHKLCSPYPLYDILIMADFEQTNFARFLR